MFKTIKSKVIFVTIFSIICICITLGLIMYKNIEIDEEYQTENINNQISTKDVQGIDVQGTYNQNDLIIKNKKATKDKIEISYCQISGLKNKEIENKINKELEEVALNCYKEKVKDMNEVINVLVNMTNVANFANTLSFEISYISKINDEGDSFYKGIKGLNYDLTTGEQIQIDKVFTSDVPIEDILRVSSYNSLVRTKAENNLAGELVVNNYGDIEDEIFNFMYLYKIGKITEFTFSPKYINIYYGENIINIEMSKYMDYIAIYNRYLTNESIYETNTIGLKGLYTVSERINVVNRYTYYEKGSNYFIDINLDNADGEYNEFSMNLKQEKIQNIERVVGKIKYEASQNPNNFYVLNYNMQIYTVFEETVGYNVTYYKEKGNSYEMTKHDFEENVEPFIIKYNREQGNNLCDYVYNFKEILKIEPQENIEYYNPVTGEKVVI